MTERTPTWSPHVAAPMAATYRWGRLQPSGIIRLGRFLRKTTQNVLRPGPSVLH